MNIIIFRKRVTEAHRGSTDLAKVTLREQSVEGTPSQAWQPKLSLHFHNYPGYEGWQKQLKSHITLKLMWELKKYINEAENEEHESPNTMA